MRKKATNRLLWVIKNMQETHTHTDRQGNLKIYKNRQISNEQLIKEMNTKFSPNLPAEIRENLTCPAARPFPYNLSLVALPVREQGSSMSLELLALAHITISFLCATLINY